MDSRHISVWINRPARQVYDYAADPRHEVVFTLRRGEAMSDADFESDAAAVARDLAALKRILEQH